MKRFNPSVVRTSTSRALIPKRRGELPHTTAFRADVLDGLGRPHGQKILPSKYFYDAHGSDLFERICVQPEYYPARTELALMERYAAQMAATLGPRCALIELGSGTSKKTRLLLDELESPALYVPIDISRTHLNAATERLRGAFPDLQVAPVVGDFTRSFLMPRPSGPSERTIVYVPGCTLWNLPLDDARAVLQRYSRLVGEDGGLLIGVDLVKDLDVLRAAYDDAAGVTAAFNKNLLVRMAKELGAEIDLGTFSHRAVWSQAHSRIEMHLVSQSEQTIRIDDDVFRLEPGEAIVTEYSHKFTLESFAELIASAGFEDTAGWTDDAGWFSVRYARATR